MTNQRRRIRKVHWMLTAALAGGSLFGACEIRLHDAIVGGSKEFLQIWLASLAPADSNTSTPP